jgi:hypothetical protein
MAIASQFQTKWLIAEELLLWMKSNFLLLDLHGLSFLCEASPGSSARVMNRMIKSAIATVTDSSAFHGEDITPIRTSFRLPGLTGILLSSHFIDPVARATIMPMQPGLIIPIERLTCICWCLLNGFAEKLDEDF